MANVVYHQNYRAIETRQHGTPNAWTFGHTSDANAEALATAVAAFFASQEVSLTARLSAPSEATTPPAGSRYTVAILTRDANYRIYRVNARNLDAAATDADLGLLFTGAAGGTFGLTALTDPPAMPQGNHVITSVSASIRQLPT